MNVGFTEWFRRQTMLYSQKRMPDVRREKWETILQLIPVRNDNVPMSKNEHNWHRKINLVATIIENGLDINATTPPLTGWLNRQVKLYNQQIMKPQYRLKWEKVLQIMPGKGPVKDSMTTLWNNNLQALLDYKTAHNGHIPDKWGTEPTHKYLAGWYQLHIFQQQNELLPQDWKTRFTNLNLPLAYPVRDRKIEVWQSHFEEIKAYVARHGKAPDQSYWGLYRRYRNMVKVYPTFSPEQKTLFDSLGIKKLTFRKKTNERLKELEEYVNVNHCLPNHKDSSGLHGWLQGRITYQRIEQTTCCRI